MTKQPSLLFAPKGIANLSIKWHDLQQGPFDLKFHIFSLFAFGHFTKCIFAFPHLITVEDSPSLPFSQVIK